jgi:UDP-glucose 4-epimerase
VSVAEPNMDFEINLRATFRLLETLRQCESKPFLLLASSAAVYGNPVRLPIAEADPTVPISPYGVAKLAIERYLAVYCRLYGLRGNSVRMFSPFGPRLEKQIVFELVRKLIASPQSLELLGDGTQTRDFLFVDDLIRALLHVATLGDADGAVYNIGSGTATAVAVVAQQLNEVMGLSAALRFRGESMPGYPDHWRADVSRLEALGWSATVPLREGLARTIAYFKSIDMSRFRAPTPNF